MSPRTCEQTPVTMSPTTNAVTQSRFDSRDPEVSITILPRGGFLVREVVGDERFSCLRAATSISRLYERGLSASWKRNISVAVLSASSPPTGPIGSLTIFWLQIVARLYCVWLHNDVVKVAQNFYITTCRTVSRSVYGSVPCNTM